MKSKLKITSLSPAKLKPLLELGLIELVDIQTMTKTGKPSNVKGYQISTKGITYLQKVDKTSGINIVQMIKETNNKFISLEKEFLKIQEHIKNQSMR